MTRNSNFQNKGVGLYRHTGFRVICMLIVETVVYACGHVTVHQCMLLQDIGPNERTSLLRNDPINADRTAVIVHRWDCRSLFVLSPDLYVCYCQCIMAFEKYYLPYSTLRF